MTEARINEIFSNKGNNQNQIGYYRETQHQFAQSTAQFFDSPDIDDCQVALMEAGTGVGKSLGYLVPLLLQSALKQQRVAIATFTRHLQKQLANDVEKAIEIVASHTHKKLSYAYRFGRDEYADLDLVEHYINFPPNGCAQHDTETLKCLRDWQALSLHPIDSDHKKDVHTGRISDFLEQHHIDNLPCGLVKMDICINPQTPEPLKQCYYHDIEKSKSADVLIVTQAMLMLHIKTHTELLNDERQISTLVIDEADNLTKAAESIFASSFSVNKQSSAYEELENHYPNFRLAHDSFNELKHFLMELGKTHEEDQLLLIENEALTNDVLGMSEQLIKYSRTALQSIPKKDIKALAAAYQIEGFIYELTNFCRTLDQFDSQQQNFILPMISWSNVYRLPSFYVHTLNIGYLIAQLFAKNDNEQSFFNKIMLTSATLATSDVQASNDFSAYKNEIGLNIALSRNHAVVMKEQQFMLNEYGRISMTLNSNKAKHPLVKLNNGFVFDKNFINDITDMTRFYHQQPKLIDCGSRTLILCASFRESTAIHNALNALNISSILHEKGTPLTDYLRAFRDDESSILITPSAWQGFNERFANLIITRIPFIPIDKVFTSKIQFFENKGLNINAARALVHKQALFDTYRKLAQGIGRLIRQDGDIGRLFIADPRVLKHKTEQWDTLHGKSMTKQKSIVPALKAGYQIKAWQLATVLHEGKLVNVENQVKAVLNY